MGAISTFSGNNDDALRPSQSSIRFNSVCGATRPATKGIYLDNCASGWDVSGNIVLHTGKMQIFIHSGSNNLISSNVFVSSNLASAKAGVMLNNALNCNTTSNKFVNNIVYVSNVPEGLSHSSLPPTFLRPVFLLTSPIPIVEPRSRSTSAARGDRRVGPKSILQSLGGPRYTYLQPDGAEQLLGVEAHGTENTVPRVVRGVGDLAEQRI